MKKKGSYYSCVCVYLFSEPDQRDEAVPDTEHGTAALHAAGSGHQPRVSEDGQRDGRAQRKTQAETKRTQRVEVHAGQVLLVASLHSLVMYCE